MASLLLRIQQRVELLQRDLTAIRRQFKGFRVLRADACRFGDLAVARRDPIVHEPFPLVYLIDVEILVALVPRQPFVELRDMAVHHLQLLFQHIVDGNHGVHTERTWLLEGVIAAGEDGILVWNRRVGAAQRNFHEIGGVLHQLAGRAMVGMIVARTVGDDDVRLERADDANDAMAVLKRGDQFAVRYVKYLVFSESRNLLRFLGFRIAACRQSFACHALMAFVAVAAGHEFDQMARLCQPQRRSTETQFAIIGVSAEKNESLLFSHGSNSFDACYIRKSLSNHPT